MQIKSLYRFSQATVCLLLTAGVAIAQSEVGHPAVLPIHVVLSTGQVKEFHLPKVNLSPNERAAFASQRLQLTRPHAKAQAQSPLPLVVDLGMNNVPVFDQGAWGTCATFAASAAVDALLQLTENDLISQLCNLQVGRTLGLPDADGGWEGSFGYVVLGQLDQYGYLPLTFQYAHGCGGLTEYPAYDVDNGSSMSATEFEYFSLKQFTHQDWTTILPFNRRFRPLNPEKGNIVLENVKQQLVAGHRVLFGTLIDASKGDAGSYGNYHHVKDDAWVLTDTILKNVTRGRAVAGHEIVITGYSDTACASFTDEHHETKEQCGLLRIRNSWSRYAGDQGDYYMSYDYFKTMVVEAYAIGKDVRPTEPQAKA